MEEIVIGYDYEGAGGVPVKNGFTQLGASAHELKSGKKIAGFNEYASMVGYEWEERCVKEFWEKNPERYEETKEKTSKAVLTCGEVVAKFVNWCRALAKDRACVVISDNQIYDGGILKCYSGIDVMYLLGRRTVYYETSSVYMGMYLAHKRIRLDEASDDVSSKKAALEALGLKDFPKTEVSHDHHPENDAENMVNQWIYIQNNV